MSLQSLIHCIEFICLLLPLPADLPTLSEQYALKTCGAMHDAMH